MSGHFSVKNFERYQHYKDRLPPWIKLYNTLLDDYEFGNLPDASKAHFLAIMLLASRYDNSIPYDADWISRRINATDPVDLSILEKHGFIVLDQGCSNMLADCKQLAMPETETETETEKKESVLKKTKKKKAGYSEDFESFWQAYPGRGKKDDPKKPAATIFERHVKNGIDPADMISGARAYAAKQAGEDPAFNAMAQTWLNQERWEDLATNGASPTPKADRKARIAEFDKRMAESGLLT